MVKIIILFLLVISYGNAKEGPSFEITKIAATEEEIIIHGAQLENIEGVSLRTLNKEILKKYQVNNASGDKLTAHAVDERPLPSNENLYLVFSKSNGEVSYPIAIASQGEKKVTYKISRKKKVKSPKNIEVDENSSINFYPSSDYTGYDYDYTMLTNSLGDLVIKGFDKTLFKLDQFGNLEISGTLKVKGKSVEVPFAPDKTNLRISNVVIGEDNSISGVTTFSSSGNMDVATGTFHVDSTNGRVGIGNATPSVKLDVSGTANSGIRLKQGGLITNAGTDFKNGMVFENATNTNAFGIGYGVGDLFSINSWDGSFYRNIFSLDKLGNGVISGSLKIGAYTLPAADGATGTVLTTNGAGVVSWTASGNGDVVGPVSSVANTLPVFSNTTGKLLSNGKPLYVDLTPGATDPAYVEGRLFFDDAANSAAIYTDVDGVKINLGQALTFKVRNTSGANIPKGSVVRTTGSQGNRPTIALAQANSLTTSGAVGVTAQAIANNNDGFVTSFGAVRDLNTSAYSTTTVLYLSSTTAGGLTDTPPTIAVRIGRVLNPHGTQGIIGVSIFSNNPGTVTNSTGAATNTVALFSDVSGTIVKNTPYTIPTTACSNGQVLRSDGANFICSTTGTGDVVGPASSTDGFLAVFDGNTGKLIRDSGKNSEGVVGMINASFGSENLIVSDVSGGRLIKDSAIPIANIPKMASPSTGARQIIISAGAGGKDLTTTIYPIQETIGASGTVLKSDGANAIWQVDAGVRLNGTFTNAQNHVAKFLNSDGSEIGDSGIDVISLVQMETVPIGPNYPLVTTFAGDKGAKPATYQIPGLIGAAGTVLKSNGLDATWETDNGGIGDVVGPASSTDGNMAIFNGTTGKVVNDSGIASMNIATMADVATAPNQMVLSTGLTKSLTTTPYSMPNSIVGTNGLVLKSNGVNAIWSEDAGAASLKLTKWEPFTAYKTDEIQFAGEDNNWLIRTSTDTVSSDAWWKDQNNGKTIPIAPPLVTTGVVTTSGTTTLSGFNVTVPAGTGYIADYFESDSPYPIFKVLTWPQTVLTIPGTGIYTIYIDNTGTPRSIAGYPTPEFLTQNISIAVADTYFGTIYDSQTFPTNPVGQIRELGLFFGGMTKNLNYKNRNTTKEVSRSAYKLYGFGLNTSINSQRPNTIDIPGENLMTFLVFTQTQPESQNLQTSLNTTVYDAGGALSDADNSKYLFARFYSDAKGEDIVMYSQNAGYTSLPNAEKAAVDPNFIVPERVSNAYIFNGYVAYQKGDNNLSDNTFYSCNPFSCDTGAGGGGGSSALLDATLGPESSVPNRLAIFADDTGKNLNQSSFAIPSIPGTSGQVLATNGDGTTAWATPVAGDVVGTSSSTVDNLASYSDGSGKAIKDSGIATANIPTMGPVATAPNQIIISAGAGGKQFSTTLYPIADTIGTAGTVLKSDGANALWQADATQGPNDVQGPASVIDSSLALYDGTTGKLIKSSPYKMPTTSCAANEILKSNGADFICVPNLVIEDNLISNSTINGLSANQGKILDGRITPLEANTHTHANKILLDSLTSTGSPTDFLAADGNYKIPDLLEQWEPGKDYKVGQLLNAGKDNYWLIKVLQDHTSAPYFDRDMNVGKTMALSPPVVTSGLLTGGQVSLTGTTVTVLIGSGILSRYTTLDSPYPVIKYVFWDTQSIDLPPTGIYSVAISENGVLTYSSGFQAQSFATDNIAVGIIDMNLRKAYERATFPTDPIGQTRSLSLFFGGMTDGLGYSAAGTVLSRTGYDAYYWGANSKDRINPNIKSFPASSPSYFYEYKQNGAVTPATRRSSLRTDVYDNNGIITPLSNNKWGFARIYTSLGEDDYVMYSQTQYNDRAAAETAARTGDFIKPQDLELSKFSGFVVFVKGDTDLSDNQFLVCEPFGCDKLGSAAGGGGGGDVLGPTSSLAGNLASFSDSTGKIIQDSLVVAANIPSMAAGTSANQIIISAGAKNLSSTLYQIPSTIGASGTVLKSNGTNATWETDFGGTGDVVGPVGPTTANRPALFADGLGKNLTEAPFTLPITAGTTGQVLGLTGPATANWVDAGNVVGPANSTDNAIARFDLATGKLIQGSGVLVDDSNNITGISNVTINGSLTINNNGANSSAFPTTRGSNGQALITNGAGTLSWGSVLSAPTSSDKTGNYTITGTDCQNTLTFTSATPATFTVPNTLPVGCQINIVQMGTAQVSFTGTGITVTNGLSMLKTRAQFSPVTLLIVNASYGILGGDVGN